MAQKRTDEDQWLAQMRAIYLSTADDKIGQLDADLSGLAHDPANKVAFRRMDRLLHNLVGSGGSYGVPEVSEVARLMLRTLKSQRESIEIGHIALADLHAGIEELRHVFAAAE
jgi:chemotaxis protein histidine kinase CheA